MLSIALSWVVCDTSLGKNDPGHHWSMSMLFSEVATRHRNNPGMLDSVDGTRESYRIESDIELNEYSYILLCKRYVVGM